jgi:hypothetical protein
MSGKGQRNGTPHRGGGPRELDHVPDRRLVSPVDRDG